MYNRFDLYGPVHKGLRLALSGLCLQAGSVDSTDTDKVQSFIEEFKRVAIILQSHSRDEDAHMNPSYETYAPETLAKLEEEHSGLEQRLEKLSELVEGLEGSMGSDFDRRRVWYEVGKDINCFTADYFVHLQREEGPGMQALWAHLTDDELKVISQKIRSSIPPEAMSIFLYYMIPAISHTERLDMLMGMKKFAPKEAYHGVLRLAESRLEDSSFIQLLTDLEESKTEGMTL